MGTRAFGKCGQCDASLSNTASDNAIGMINDIYNKRILELAGNIPRLGRLDRPDGTARANSRLCGSTVTVDVKLDSGRVSDFAHDVKACALGQASSALMARHVIGLTQEQIAALREQMRAMLKDGAPPPSGEFEEFACLEPVREFKARHASTMLTFDATLEAVQKAMASTTNVPAGV